MRWMGWVGIAAVAVAFTGEPAGACSVYCAPFEVWQLELVDVEVLDGDAADAPEWGPSGRLDYGGGFAQLTTVTDGGLTTVIDLGPADTDGAP